MQTHDTMTKVERIVRTMNEAESMVCAALADLSASQKHDLISYTLEHFGFARLWPDENIVAAVEKRKGSATMIEERVVLHVVQFIARCCEANRAEA